MTFANLGFAVPNFSSKYSGKVVFDMLIRLQKFFGYFRADYLKVNLLFNRSKKAPYIERLLNYLSKGGTAS